MNRQKIKILYIVSTLRRSGPTSQLLSVLDHLDTTKFDPMILTLSPEPENSAKDNFLERKLKIDSLNLGRVQFFFFGKRKLKQYINKYNPDIIHTSGIRADVTISKISTKFKHCMTVHNYVFDDYIAKYGKLIGYLASRSALNSMRRCENVICCSETLKNLYEKLLHKSLYAIQNGIDICKFKPVSNKNAKDKLREKLDLPKDKLIFLLVGSLIKIKDPLTAIKAFKKANTGNKAQLVVLGDGELFDECVNMSNEKIKIKGYVDNVNEYLQASNVYISSSTSEGLPYSVLEAASSGLGLLLSNIPQHKEVFSNVDTYQSSELFFNVGNSDDLSRLIEQHVRNSMKNNENYTNIIRDQFSSTNMSRKYQDFYFDLVKD